MLVSTLRPVLLILLVLLALAPPAAFAAGVPQTVLDRIQRECLKAYPPEMLAKMASGNEKVPEEVDADPKAQMQFLDKELDGEKGLFYPILLEDILPAFELYVSEDVRFLDLDSGDGRVLFLAAALGAEATGIEYDGEIAEISRRALAALDDLVDPERVHIVEGDFFETSWSGWDVIFYFDFSTFEQQRLRKKLARELDPGARLVIAYQREPFPGLEVEREIGRNLKIYVRPLEAVGK